MRRAGALAAVAVAALTLGACSAPAEPIQTAAPDVGIQLFQLPWTSIAQECESTLSDAGIAWVLTSPPQEHIQGSEWWTSYQPVSYRIESRLGTREQFADMVQRCRAQDIDVIADAVVNHMTGQDAAGTGWAGSPFEHYEYPGIHTAADFHHCGLTVDDDIADYDSRQQVQTCELVNLADLDTSSETVRTKIRAYLRDLLSLGVAGLRIDAAKHIAADDLTAIVQSLPEDTRIIAEVIRGPLEPIQPDEYLGIGEVFEFAYARDLTPQLQSATLYDPDLSEERPMHVPASSAVVFVDNHDTERGEAKITYRDGPLYLVANVLMLADDYGTPVLYSGYAFSDRDAGPPTEADGTISPGRCVADPGPSATYQDGARTCTQAWEGIRGMLQWRSVVGDAPRLPGVAESSAYGFERQGRGAVAVNAGGDEVTIALATSMPDGTYCDVVESGRFEPGDACAEGSVVSVREGKVTFELGAESASAIHLSSRIE